MPDANHLTVLEKLLLAAYALEESRSKTFTAEDLVVSAWSMFPTTFGLKGYLDGQGTPMHPDSNRVFAEIMGSKPLRKRGYLSKTGPKQYALTETGRRIAQELQLPGPRSAQRARATRSSLPRDFDRLLRRMISSRASNKVKGGDTDGLSFFDACMFWGITPQSSAMKMSERLENAKQVVAVAHEVVGEGAVKTSSGMITHEDLQLLEEVDETLRERFKAELETIAGRRDERQMKS